MARSGAGFFLLEYEATAACYSLLGGLPSNNRGMDNVHDKFWDFDNIKSHADFCTTMSRSVLHFFFSLTSMGGVNSRNRSVSTPKIPVSINKIHTTLVTVSIPVPQTVCRRSRRPVTCSPGLAP
jgi:hypothetical protein